MKKRILTLTAAAVLILSMQTFAAAENDPDVVSQASVKDFYSDYAISGDELMEAVNSFSGFYAVSTVNEDGTPQLGYFVFSMQKDGDEYYLLLGLEENQTREYLLRTGTATAMYAVRPEDDAQPQYAVSGARLNLELVTDEKLVEKLNTKGYDSTLFCRVTSVRSLG